MNIFNKVFATLAVATSLCLSACGLGETIVPKKLDSAETWQEVITGLKENFADKKIVRVTVQEAGQLSNALGILSIDFVTAEGTAEQKSVARANGAWEESTTFVHELYRNGYKYEGVQGVSTEQIKPEQIIAYIQEAIKLIPEEYEFESVGSYSIQELFDEDSKNKLVRSTGKYGHFFELHVTEKGKSKEIKGRTIETTYYGVKFELDESGKVILSEDQN